MANESQLQKWSLIELGFGYCVFIIMGTVCYAFFNSLSSKTLKMTICVFTVQINMSRNDQEHQAEREEGK